MRRFAVLVVLGMAFLWAAYRTIHPIPTPVAQTVQSTHLLQTSEDGGQLWYVPDAQAIYLFEKEHPGLACKISFLGDELGYRLMCRKITPAQDVTIP